MSSSKILLVEDEGALLMLVGDALEDLGFEVTPASDGLQAGAALETGGYDVVITDINMPGGVSGLDIAARALECDPPARVILTSGLSRAQLPPLPQDASFLPKPYRVSQLLHLLGH